MSLREESRPIATAPTGAAPRQFWGAVRGEVRPMTSLALPVILAELGWMFMGIVDTIMVGSLGPQAIGAVGVGLFMAIGIFGMGVLLGLDTLVSQAYGATRLDECHRWLWHGLVMVALLTVPLMLIVVGLSYVLELVGLHPDVLPLARSYLLIVNWSLPPLLAYAALRRYLQGMSFVAPIAFALVTANIINAVANWALIYGHWGAPTLGTDGSAWATVAARIYMALVLVAAAVWHARRGRTGLFDSSLRVDGWRLRRLLTLGVPAASQVTMEVGVFAASSALAGRLVPTMLAAHQIALYIAAFTFMVPLGMSSAAAVRVGQAIGRRDPHGAAHAGWTAIGLIGLFMSLVAAVFLLAPRLLITLFTADASVVHIAVMLLAVGAMFQLFDGLQGVTTGALRGLGETRTAMLANLIGHWAIGLPLGCFLCFTLGWNVIGLWIGLGLGLFVVAISLLIVWSRSARGLLAPRPPA